MHDKFNEMKKRKDELNEIVRLKQLIDESDGSLDYVQVAKEMPLSDD